MTPETQSGRRVTWPAIVALVLVPLLAVAALLALTRPGGDEQISAAVVNLDEAVTVNGQLVPMGRQLAAAMIERDGENVSWTLADEPSAADGLASGEFAAVVTIPQGFSAAATSFSENDADTAQQATIEVQVSENAPVTDAQLAQQIARLATDTINATLTEGYLDGIYVGFNTVGEQFSTIVDGAQQLSDGSAQLADGTLQSSQGANQLSDGMALLGENGPKLADGGDQLVIGIRELSSGSSQLAAGAAELADGTQQFADGADQLLTGIPAFADGAAQAIGGVGQLRDGLDQVIAGLDQPQDFSQLEQLAAGARQTADGAAGLSGGIGQVNQAMQGFSSGAIPAPDQVTAIGGQIAAGFECPVADPATCEMLQQTFAAGASAGVSAGFQAGTGTASAALTTPDAATGLSLVAGAEALAGGAAQLADGVDQLVTELPAQTEAQLGELKAGLTQIRDGADTLATEAQPIVDNAPAISAGATQLNDGAGELADGALQFADGVAQLDDGVGQLETGAATFVDGLTQYTEGVTSAADGTALLADGLSQLSDGARQLDDGVTTFATELAKGADQVPTYSPRDRERLATVVAAPVDTPDDLLESGRVPLVSLLLVAGLWLGAAAGFVVSRPIPRDVVTSRASSLAMWAQTMWLPLAVVAAQGLVLGLVGGVVLDVGFGSTVALAALLVVMGASFVFTNHALAGWLGNAGRAVSLLLLVMTVALGLSSAASWLSPIAAVSPLHNGLLLVRAWLSGGSGEIGLATMAVLMAAVGLLLSVLAVSSRRRITVEQYLRAA
ncbi:YhgE/Pip domain-containing protein [Tessaracoccus sp. MC1679]|uniref:YhgE/Pip domain-containing protein n=1 Tax=Tessaracoccus sp. MC1679 TaxID=2760313 RepID=UPI0016012DCC|nr:YhgE/Pip domain-containing protein [Tessaracoccus sp. MC1679]MBB1514946.1 YhgE/Pip domain-containing protein [Tessaracoccus sp. MC1679]